MVEVEEPGGSDISLPVARKELAPMTPKKCVPDADASQEVSAQTTAETDGSGKEKTISTPDVRSNSNGSRAPAWPGMRFRGSGNGGTGGSISPLAPVFSLDARKNPAPSSPSQVRQSSEANGVALPWKRNGSGSICQPSPKDYKAEHHHKFQARVVDIDARLWDCQRRVEELQGIVGSSQGASRDNAEGLRRIDEKIVCLQENYRETVIEHVVSGAASDCMKSAEEVAQACVKALERSFSSQVEMIKDDVWQRLRNLQENHVNVNAEARLHDLELNFSRLSLVHDQMQTRVSRAATPSGSPQRSSSLDLDVQESVVSRVTTGAGLEEYPCHFYSMCAEDAFEERLQRLEAEMKRNRALQDETSSLAKLSSKNECQGPDENRRIEDLIDSLAAELRSAKTDFSGQLKDIGHEVSKLKSEPQGQCNLAGDQLTDQDVRSAADLAVADVAPTSEGLDVSDLAKRLDEQAQTMELHSKLMADYRSELPSLIETIADQIRGRANDEHMLKQSRVALAADVRALSSTLVATESAIDSLVARCLATGTDGANAGFAANRAKLECNQADMSLVVEGVAESRSELTSLLPRLLQAMRLDENENGAPENQDSAREHFAPLVREVLGHAQVGREAVDSLMSEIARRADTKSQLGHIGTETSNSFGQEKVSAKESCQRRNATPGCLTWAYR